MLLQGHMGYEYCSVITIYGNHTNIKTIIEGKDIGAGDYDEPYQIISGSEYLPAYGVSDTSGLYR